MKLEDLEPRDLARALAQVIAERLGSREGPANLDPHESRGYYGVSGDDTLLEDELEDQLLDGRDDLVAICAEALARLVAKGAA